MSGNYPILSIFPESSKYKICISDSACFFEKRAFSFFLGNSYWKWNLSETNTHCIFSARHSPTKSLYTQDEQLLNCWTLQKSSSQAFQKSNCQTCIFSKGYTLRNLEQCLQCRAWKHTRILSFHRIVKRNIDYSSCHLTNDYDWKLTTSGTIAH